jgi:CheY-like chemotaxis protein
MITVLAVDDDPDVLDLVSELLTEHGYRVLKASDPSDALALVARDAEIGLLLTDVVMPGGMNGVELAERVRRRRPKLPILYISGYATAWDPQVTHGKLLAKPWHAADLLREVKAALAR